MGSMKSGTKFTDMLSRIRLPCIRSVPSQFFVRATQPYTYQRQNDRISNDAADVYGKPNKWMFKNLTNKRGYVSRV